jgi:hypothetical protein
MEATAERATVEAGEESIVFDESENIGSRIEQETLDILVRAKLIQDSERGGFQKYLTSTQTAPGTILPVMADLRRIEEGMKSQTIEKWARDMSPVLKRRYPLVPFASRLLTPTAIYEKYPAVKNWAEQARCPIVYAEDTDVIGFGVINPVAGVVLAEQVSAFFQEKTGVMPFISLFLLTFDSWRFLSERQFDK